MSPREAESAASVAVSAATGGGEEQKDSPGKAKGKGDRTGEFEEWTASTPVSARFMKLKVRSERGIRSRKKTCTSVDRRIRSECE